MGVDSRRIHSVRPGTPDRGAVVYWMQRDQRVSDNHALLYAQELALAARQPLYVVFCLVPGFLGATIRQYGFMCRGLAGVERTLAGLGIPFHLLAGDPPTVIPRFLRESGAGCLVTDFNPLRTVMRWKDQVAAGVDIPFHEVDAHNIVPCRFISDRAEYAAFTLRKKTGSYLPEFMTGTGKPVPHPFPGEPESGGPVDWERLLAGLQVDRSVGESNLFTPGEEAATVVLNQFLDGGLDRYDADRNLPERNGQSDLSPYLHFGQLSALRVALEVTASTASTASRQSFLEELIVRRELSDNFCLYNPGYDRFSGFQPWAKETLNRHRDDPREYLYTPDRFDRATTHDPLWNAAQREMVISGKMHGYLRMYWAKKILEWSPSPEEAMETAIWLNDRYQLDGRDPNGYAGIAWSIGGIHDRPWGERKVYGMIRYMNDKGCRRKFDVDAYIKRWSLHGSVTGAMGIET